MREWHLAARERRGCRHKEYLGQKEMFRRSQSNRKQRVRRAPTEEEKGARARGATQGGHESVGPPSNVEGHSPRLSRDLDEGTKIFATRSTGGVRPSGPFALSEKERGGRTGRDKDVLSF